MIAQMEDDGSIRITKGLAWVIGLIMSCLAILVVPWAWRVERVLTRFTDTMARIEERSNLWTAHSTQLSDHITEANLHYTLVARLDALERRIDLCEIAKSSDPNMR